MIHAVCFEYLIFKANKNWHGSALIIILGSHLLSMCHNYDEESLRALGILTELVLSPLIEVIVDKSGHKKSAMFFYLLETIINQTDQCNYLAGMKLSRSVDRITTNFYLQ